MGDELEKEDPNFNPMNIETFRDKKKLEERGLLELYNLAMSDFKQQNMPALRPIPTLFYSVSVFLIIIVVCLAFGIPLLILSSDIVEVEQRYDNQCSTVGSTCSIQIEVKDKMSSPVYMYYQLENYHQNHRIYMKSYVLSQLEGDDLSVSSLSDCDPIEHMYEVGYSTNPAGVSYDHYAWLLKNHDAAYPCGLIAKSFFNDTYALKDSTGQTIKIRETGIAWSDDIGKYKNVNLNNQWLNVENEHFIVWMHPAGLPNFRKRWGIIDQDLPVGKYIFTIQNNYNVGRFDGKKSIVLSTANSLGGKNYILGGFFIAVAGLSFLLCAIFLVAYKVKHSKETAISISERR